MSRSPRLSVSAIPTLSALIGACCLTLTSACSISGTVDEVFQSGEGGGAAGGNSGGATSSGGGTAGTTTNTTSTTNTTTTTETGPEDCTDGVDNDGDGATDCADSDCQPGFECVTAAPDGWLGYFRVVRTDYPTAPPACDGGSAADVFFSGPAGPPECTACSCGDVQGASCTQATLTCWAGSGICAGPAADWTQALADGQCHKPSNLLGFANNLSCSITQPAQLVQKGSCTPSGVDFPNKDPWQNEIGACGVPATGGGCDAGKTCVPKANPGSAEKICIQAPGTAACPAGTFQEAVQAYTGGADNRTCTACTCGDSGAACAGGTTTVNDLDGCVAGGAGTDPSVVVDSGACKDVSALLDLGSWSMMTTLATAKGTCQHGGGAPTGTVSPDGPSTFCCK